MYFIGKLCKRGHEHKSSGGSLRYKSSRQCIACTKEYAAKRGSRKEYLKAWEKAHPESAKKRQRKYRDKVKRALAFYKKQQVAKNN